MPQELALEERLTRHWLERLRGTLGAGQAASADVRPLLLEAPWVAIGFLLALLARLKEALEAADDRRAAPVKASKQAARRHACRTADKPSVRQSEA
jgi:hypothetical protein